MNSHWRPDVPPELIVQWLKTPDAFSSRPDSVDYIETHISHVFLAGPDVYKLKKPVKYDFLDYSTLSAREHACREEVRLNRRLAPDAYLGVVPVVVDQDGRFEIGGTGQVVDWLVHMRRLPTDMTLEALVRRGELKREHIDRLARVLVHFYQSLWPLPITPRQYRERCLSHIQGNLRELLSVKHHLRRGVVERIHGFQLQLLALQPMLFEQRVQAGRVVDGHGDLRPEHICLGEPIEIFDCIEFSADFRRIDVADELAFLAAECEFLGAGWVGPQLLTAYQRQTGDTPPPILIAFYKSYRACVRAKVAALRADQVADSAQKVAATEAHQHLALADRHVAAWLRPLVVAVGGLSGTGKTTLANALSRSLGAELLRTDVVRQEIYGAENSAKPNSGVYTEESRRHVYEEMLRRASVFQSDQISVVLDGTYSSVEVLRQAQSIAGGSRSIFMAVECVCRTDIAQERIKQRLTAGRDASDANSEVYEFQRQLWQEWPAEISSIRIDTGQPLEVQVEQVVAALATAYAK
jgi:aminoglycoside phosphotransferase family enzyme/predicted kinase